jgi:hypothetical protein
MKVRMDDGSEIEGGPGDTAVIPPGLFVLLKIKNSRLTTNENKIGKYVIASPKTTLS